MMIVRVPMLYNDVPEFAHYVASFRLGDGEHHVEVWRDRSSRVKRRTDDAIETLVLRPAGAVEWSMTVLDLKRHIRTDVARMNLFRIGHVTDWFALAHSLSRPLGPYTLAALSRDAVPSNAPVAPCRWYVLTQAEHSSRICWSTATRVPLLIVGADGAVQWQITTLDTRPLTAGAFAIDDRGFARNDADRDIEVD